MSEIDFKFWYDEIKNISRWTLNHDRSYSFDNVQCKLTSVVSFAEMMSLTCSSNVIDWHFHRKSFPRGTRICITQLKQCRRPTATIPRLQNENLHYRRSMPRIARTKGRRKCSRTSLCDVDTRGRAPPVDVSRSGNMHCRRHHNHHHHHRHR